MNAFLHTVLTFPTLPWSVLLAVSAAYWVLAATGLLHHSGSDAGHHAGDAASHSEGAGMFARIGLGGVPVTVALTALAFTGWVLTYFVHLLLLAGLPDGVRVLLGLVTLVASVIVGVLVTSQLLRPLRMLGARLGSAAPRSLAGRVGTVTSAHVDERSGRMSVEDGGAGLVLEVRTTPPDRPLRGQRVVILSHDRATHTYLIVSEDRFNA